MDRSRLGFDQNFSDAADDFPSLLRRKGLLGPTVVNPMPQKETQQHTWQPTDATTILAFKFSGGVLVAEIAVRLRVTPSSMIVRIRFWRLIRIP